MTETTMTSTSNPSLKTSEDFKMPEFTRIAWVSKNAQDYWQPIIRTIQISHDEVEVKSIRDFRKCALVFVEKKRLIQFNEEILRLGLSDTVVDESNTHYRIAVSTNVPALIEFTKAWKIQDTFAIATLLGYPVCCAHKFDERWKAGFRDLNAFMGAPKHPENNIFLRWIGVRPFFHLPCSSECKLSAELGNHILLIHETAIQDQMVLLLSMRFEYTSLHGIVQVKTPIFTIVANGDMHNEEIKIRGMENGGVVKYSATGKNFPYAREEWFKQEGIPLEFRKQEQNANGFSNIKTQEFYHQPIINWFRDMQGSLTSPIRIVDLGCGDGMLMKEIGKVFEYHPIFTGVEYNKGKVEAAMENLPQATILFDTIYNWSQSQDKDSQSVILIAKQRFLEEPRLQLQELLQIAKIVMVYDYSSQYTTFKIHSRV